MLNLIEKTKASGVLFISGDVHYSEISKLNSEITYPIYDFTSSGLSSFGSPSSSSSGFSRGAGESLGLQERLTALRDCFNDGLLNESEFNELREKALKFL